MISENSEIMVICLLRKEVPRPVVLLFTRKKLHQWNRLISQTCSIRFPRASVHQSLRYLMTPCLLQLHSYGLQRERESCTLLINVWNIKVAVHSEWKQILKYLWIKKWTRKDKIWQWKFNKTCKQKHYTVQGCVHTCIKQGEYTGFISIYKWRYLMNSHWGDQERRGVQWSHYSCVCLLRMHFTNKLPTAVGLHSTNCESAKQKHRNRLPAPSL